MYITNGSYICQISKVSSILGLHVMLGVGLGWMVDGGGVGLCAGERSITTNTFKLTNSFN